MKEAYISYMKSEKMSENTIKSYTSQIKQMLDIVGKPENEITYLDLIDWKANVHGSSATMANKVACCKSYFKFLHEAGIIENNPSEKLARPKNVRNKEKPYMSEEDIKKFINASRTIRDKAIFKFMVSTGVRFCEMASITVRQYLDAMSSDRTIELKVTKGDKGGKIYINDSTKEAIDTYLKTRNDTCEYLFVSFGMGKMSDNALSYTIKTTAKRAGLPYWEQLSCHCLRAACATLMSDKGVPVATISKVLRHSSLVVTTRYIKVNQDNVNNATALMEF